MARTRKPAAAAAKKPAGRKPAGKKAPAKGGRGKAKATASTSA